MTKIRDDYKKEDRNNPSEELEEEKEDNRILNCSNEFFRDLITYLERKEFKG